MLDAWLRIDADGTVTIFTGKIELGQGIGTALAQIAADELDVDLKRIRMVHGDTALTPNEGQTAGSLSVENSGTAVRYRVRRSARHAAFRRRRRSSATQRAEGGRRHHQRLGSASPTGTLAGELRSEDAKPPRSAKPKPAAEHKWVGKSVPRHDIPKKFTGGAAYVQDVRLPGMVFGRVVRPPSPGAKLISVDEVGVQSDARRRRGRARRQLPRRRRRARRAGDQGARRARAERGMEGKRRRCRRSGAALYEHMQSLDVPATGDGRTGARPTRGAGREIASKRATRARSRRTRSIGPSCAVAQWTGRQAARVDPQPGRLSRCAATSPTCSASSRRRCAAPTSKAPAATATTAPTTSRSTRRCSRARPAAAPVKLQWMRDDEFMWEPYGSAMVMKLGARARRAGQRRQLVARGVEPSAQPRARAQSKGSHTARGAAPREAGGAAPVGDVPQPSGGADRNAIPLYDFPSVEGAPSTSSSRRRCAPRRCARSAATPTCSRSSRSWTSWPPPPAPTRSSSGCAT